jgi:hypothetical protein
VRKKKVSGKSCHSLPPHTFIHAIKLYLDATYYIEEIFRISAPALCVKYPTRGLSRQIRHSLTDNIPKSQVATQAAELTAHKVKLSPAPLSYTMRTKQPHPTLPMFSACNPHSMLTTPCRKTSCGTKPKKQVGLCCALSLRARWNIYTSRQGTRTTAELNILRKRFEAIKVLREEIHALKHGAASADELREPVVRLEVEPRVRSAKHGVSLPSFLFAFPV